MSSLMLNDTIDVNPPQSTEVGFADPVRPSDGQLVSAVLNGDERAFEEIFERYRRLVSKTVGKFFRDRNDVEEFVQQSFTKVYLSLSKFKGSNSDSLAPWITRISVNVCYDEFRRRSRNSENLTASFSDNENDHLEMMIEGRPASAEDSVVRSQLAEKVLASLSPKDRIAVTMVYSEDYTLAEAAGALGISTSSLKSRLFRCRSQLKTRFNYLFK